MKLNNGKTVFTIVLNDPPYGSERSYNGMRLALELLKDESVQLNLFLMADAVFCALRDQETPQGYYNLGRMMRRATTGGQVRACISCMDARGVKEEFFIDGVKSGDMALLADWVKASDKVIMF